MSREVGASSTQPKDFMNTNPSFDFTDPNTRHDRVLIVGGQKFYVQMGLLAGWSEYFHALTTSGLKETDQHEIEIQDVIADEFHCFLQVIYPTEFDITVANVFSLVSLSYRFLAPRVLALCKQFIESNFADIDKIDLLTIAFKYGLDDIKEKVAKSIKTETPVGYIRECDGCHARYGFQYCPSCAMSSVKPYRSFTVNNNSYVVKNKDRILAAPSEVKDFLLNTFLSCE